MGILDKLLSNLTTLLFGSNIDDEAVEQGNKKPAKETEGEKNTPQFWWIDVSRLDGAVQSLIEDMERYLYNPLPVQAPRKIYEVFLEKIIGFKNTIHSLNISNTSKSLLSACLLYNAYIILKYRYPHLKGSRIKSICNELIVAISYHIERAKKGYPSPNNNYTSCDPKFTEADAKKNRSFNWPLIMSNKEIEDILTIIDEIFRNYTGEDAFQHLSDLVVTTRPELTRILEGRMAEETCLNPFDWTDEDSITTMSPQEEQSLGSILQRLVLAFFKGKGEVDNEKQLYDVLTLAEIEYALNVLETQKRANMNQESFKDYPVLIKNKTILIATKDLLGFIKLLEGLRLDKMREVHGRTLTDFETLRRAKR